jgi:hypothetical protein
MPGAVASIAELACHIPEQKDPEKQLALANGCALRKPII